MTRMLLALPAVLFGAAVLATGAAEAQTYPDRPIRLIIPFTPGGGTDNLSRLVGNKLTEKNRWAVVMENKAGASGTIGVQDVAKAAPTGYELVQREGEPPPVGSIVELDGQGRWVVNRIGQSPLPQDRRPCAYLLPTTS